MEICRLCFENTGTFDIFEDTLGTGTSISSKIMYCCATIRIHRGDGLPIRVCNICEMELSHAYQFVLKCETADKKLQLLRLEFRKLSEDEVKLETKIEEDSQTGFDYSFIEVTYSNDTSEIQQYKKSSAEEPDTFSNSSKIKTAEDTYSNGTSEIKQSEDSSAEDPVTFPNSPKIKTIEDTPSNNTLKIQQYEDSTAENRDALLKLGKIKTTKKKKWRDEGGKRKCKKCGRQCNSLSTLIIHMRTHSDERPYACQSCDKRYKDGGSLKRHIERNHNQDRKRKVICEFCGKAFYSHNEIKTHLRTHTGETPYACSICPSKFTQLSSLIRHQLRHTGEKPHSCPICKKKFRTMIARKRHEVAHTTEKKFNCVMCNINFKYSQNLKKHVLQHTIFNNFICDYCGQTFKTKGSVKLHISRKHSSKSGTCHICSKNMSNLEVHMWIHSGKRPLKCDRCPSSFSDKRSLSRHINYKHKYSDKFKCTVNGCTSSFPTQPMLEFHVVKLHSSIVPFPCGICSKGFYRKSDLNKHKLHYHKEVLNKG